MQTLDRWLILITGLALSVVAALFSVVGLTAIFAGAWLAIVILGGTLEVGKIVLASWLYRNWKYVPFLMKTYFMIAILVLMLITSMGIFGFLSKAHLEQTAPAGGVIAKIERIDANIAREKNRIERADAQIAQLDKAIDSIISRNNRAQTALNYRRRQAKERAALANQVKESQANIDNLMDAREPLASKNRALKNEVGPVRYVAELIYGQGSEKDLEAAVRMMILLLVFVIDPLAVLMIIAASKDLRPRKFNEEDAVETDGNIWDDIKMSRDGKDLTTNV